MKKKVYFDMTDVYKKLSASRDKKTREKVKNKKEWDSPLDLNKPVTDANNSFI